jgi:acetyltransferase-like isoleucine patch superfamily enzyme
MLSVIGGSKKNLISDTTKRINSMTLSYLWARLCKKIRGSAVINSRFHKTSKIEAGSNIINTTFGRYSFCGYDCTIVNCDVGAFCSIASNVIIGGARHPMEWVSMSPVFYKGRDSITKKFSNHNRGSEKRTSIGNDVWIGENALIKAGVRIGDGVVIGMGSVVTKDVPPYAIVAGCPAKVIRKRFDDHIIDKLLKIKWWDFDEVFLQKYAKYVMCPDDFIREVEQE